MTRPVDLRQSRERTLMKTTQPYAPDLDLRVDVVMVFGYDDTLGERIRSWREAG